MTLVTHNTREFVTGSSGSYVRRLAMMATAPLRRAVLPAAGFGTRMLPAARAVPKELLPILDRPTVQYVVEEAAAAGITDVTLVTSPLKPRAVGPLRRVDPNDPLRQPAQTPSGKGAHAARAWTT